MFVRGTLRRGALHLCSRDGSGGIAKSLALDDGSIARGKTIVKDGVLGDATHCRFTLRGASAHHAPFPGSEPKSRAEQVDGAAEVESFVLLLEVVLDFCHELDILADGDGQPRQEEGEEAAG